MNLEQLYATSNAMMSPTIPEMTQDLIKLINQEAQQQLMVRNLIKIEVENMSHTNKEAAARLHNTCKHECERVADILTKVMNVIPPDQVREGSPIERGEGI